MDAAPQSGLATAMSAAMNALVRLGIEGLQAGSGLGSQAPLRRRRRTCMAARPTKPDATSAMVPGSGVADKEDVDDTQVASIVHKNDAPSGPKPVMVSCVCSLNIIETYESNE